MLPASHPLRHAPNHPSPRGHACRGHCHPRLCQTAKDGPPVDAAQILQALRQLRQIQEQAVQQRRTAAYQAVASACQSGASAAALWKEAVRTVQFKGADREGAQFREWKDREGDALSSKEAENAARLHMLWLALTLQHSSGVKTRDLLDQVVKYTGQLQADTEMMEQFSEQMEKEKERASSGTHGRKPRQTGPDDGPSSGCMTRSCGRRSTAVSSRSICKSPICSRKSRRRRRRS